jgi:hypothetical protein
MKCVLNERSLFSPAAATLWQGIAGHVDGSYDISVMGELFYLKIAQSAAAAKSMRMIAII